VTDIHLNVLCFTSSLCDPVMCTVILKLAKSIHDIPIAWKMGIDITNDVEDGTTNYELFENNYGVGKLLPGGHTGRFNGKEIPCFVVCRPKSCITPEMLKAMLEGMDER
jgi:hypothetical protein